MSAAGVIILGGVVEDYVHNLVWEYGFTNNGKGGRSVSQRHGVLDEDKLGSRLNCRLGVHFSDEYDEDERYVSGIKLFEVSGCCESISRRPRQDKILQFDE